jgi:hypothetical protein
VILNGHQSYTLTYWRVQHAREILGGGTNSLHAQEGDSIAKISNNPMAELPPQKRWDFVRDLDLQRAMIVDRVAPTWQLWTSPCVEMARLGIHP